MENSETSYYAARKEEDTDDRLLGSLSPIPGEMHDLSSMDHFSIITSQAVGRTAYNGLLHCLCVNSFRGHSFVKRRN